MKTYVTNEKRIDPDDNELKVYAGPRVDAETQIEAEEIAGHDFPGVTVLGVLIAEIE